MSNDNVARGAAGGSGDLRVPDTMRAWVLRGPGELVLEEKPVPAPGRAEVLVRIDAVAICATDLDVIAHGPPAMIEGGLPFNKGFTPGHEYMGTVVAQGPGVDEYKVGQRVNEVVGRESGTMTKVELWGRRRLAYDISKHKRGVYVYLKYLGNGAVVSEVERNLRLSDDVIKYQTVQTNAEVELASVAINPDDVKFEGVELPTEEEPEDSIERRLGLIEGERLQRDDEAPDVDDEDYQVPDLNDIPGTEN